MQDSSPNKTKNIELHSYHFGLTRRVLRVVVAAAMRTSIFSYYEKINNSYNTQKEKKKKKIKKKRNRLELK